MKIRTLVTFGVGYALGAKLGPKQIEELIRVTLDSESTDHSLRVSEPGPAWPDARFRA